MSRTESQTKRYKHNYYYSHQDSISLYGKKYYANNKVRCKANSKKQRQRNAAHIAEYMHKYYCDNKEHLNNYYKEWLRNNKDKAALAKMRYKARKRNASGVDYLTNNLLAARIELWGYKCYICGDQYSQIDHVKPLSKGGSNFPSNLRPICASCNISKKAKWNGVEQIRKITNSFCNSSIPLP